jgi:hypothetical protein
MGNVVTSAQNIDQIIKNNTSFDQFKNIIDTLHDHDLYFNDIKNRLNVFEYINRNAIYEKTSKGIPIFIFSGILVNNTEIKKWSYVISKFRNICPKNIYNELIDKPKMSVFLYNYLKNNQSKFTITNRTPNEIKWFNTLFERCCNFIDNHNVTYKQSTIYDKTYSYMLNIFLLMYKNGGKEIMIDANNFNLDLNLLANFTNNNLKYADINIIDNDSLDEVRDYCINYANNNEIIVSGLLNIFRFNKIWTNINLTNKEWTFFLKYFIHNKSSNIDKYIYNIINAIDDDMFDEIMSNNKYSIKCIIDILQNKQLSQNQRKLLQKYVIKV